VVNPDQEHLGALRSEQYPSVAVPRVRSNAPSGYCSGRARERRDL